MTTPDPDGPVPRPVPDGTGPRAPGDAPRPPAAPGPRPLRPSRAAAVPPAERGSTRIADRVVAKIAARAAGEALPRAPRDVAPPHATVTVHHDIARVRISLELDYPSDLGAECAAVRRTVAARVEELAGMTVPEVDIDVERLHSTHTQPSPRARLR